MGGRKKTEKMGEGGIFNNISKETKLTRGTVGQLKVLRAGGHLALSRRIRLQFRILLLAR